MRRPPRYGACYLYLDRCFVYLTRPKPRSVGVRLTSMEDTIGAGELAELVGEFANQLLPQTLRVNGAPRNPERGFHAYRLAERVRERRGFSMSRENLSTSLAGAA